MADRQSEPHAHPASFRDPASRVYLHEGRIIRALSSSAAQDYRFCSESGLLKALVEKGHLIDPGTIVKVRATGGFRSMALLV